MMNFIAITVPDNYLVFTQVHSAERLFEVDRTEIRMMSLDISGQYIDVLVFQLPGIESYFIAYDQVDHRVHFNLYTYMYMYTSVDWYIQIIKHITTDTGF